VTIKVQHISQAVALKRTEFGASRIILEILVNFSGWQEIFIGDSLTKSIYFIVLSTYMQKNLKIHTKNQK
jgi:hypothetical protein